MKRKKISEATRKRASESARKRWGDPIKRFWSHVDKSAGPDNCWKWIGAVHPRGYGQVTWYRRVTHAHRVSWQITFGPIPTGKHILHKCDNKLCVNPKHLWLGTNADNVKDRDTKGRQPRGETSGAAKLTEEQVKEIRSLAAKGILQIEISRKLGVPKSTVNWIVTRRSWKHVP